MKTPDDNLATCSESSSKLAPSIFDEKRNVIAGVIGLVLVAVALIGVYTLFIYIYMSELSVAKVKAIEEPSPHLAELAAVRSPPLVELATSEPPRLEDTEALLPGPVSPTASGGVVEKEATPAPSVLAPTVAAETTLSDRSVSNHPPVKEAKFYLELGIASYRDGDIPAAIADFDLAIELDPNLEEAYADRGVAWYRMGSVNRAFADVAQAIRIMISRQTSAPPLAQGRLH